MEIEREFEWCGFYWIGDQCGRAEQADILGMQTDDGFRLGIVGVGHPVTGVSDCGVSDQMG